MKQFKMNGYAITDAGRFQKYFSPEDILRDRELAAGFMKHHYRDLSVVQEYHADVFFGTVFMSAKRRDLVFVNKDKKTGEPTNYSSQILGLIDRKDWEREMIVRKLISREQIDLEKGIWNAVVQTSLKNDDQTRDQDVLFLLLTAAYALAEKNLEDCPLDPQRIEAAYLKRDQAPVSAQAQQPSFAKAGKIVLEPREKPYKILLKQGAAERLAAGEPIVPRKLMAGVHAQGNNEIPVTLVLYASPQDTEPQRLTLYSGEYLYVNFVGEVPVFVHPVRQESEACRMERSGSSLVCVEKRRGAMLLNERDVSLDIIGFAVEEKAAGFLLLTELGLDDSAYSRRLSRRVQKKEIVQMEFRGSSCLLLDKHGTVYSGLRAVGTGVTALDEFHSQEGSGT